MESGKERESSPDAYLNAEDTEDAGWTGTAAGNGRLPGSDGTTPEVPGVCIKGRIRNYVFDREEDGQALFVFQSDSNAQQEIPRFIALCSGKVPDVVPGVPLIVEFGVPDVSAICRIGLSAADMVTRNVREKYTNRILRARIDYQDLDYPLEQLMSVPYLSRNAAGKIMDRLGGDLSGLPELLKDKKFWAGMRGSKRYYDTLKKNVGSVIDKEMLFQEYGRYGLGYRQIEVLYSKYGPKAEKKLKSNPYSEFFWLGLGFQPADHLAKDLGFHFLDEKRVRAIINTVLHRNEEGGNTVMRLEYLYKKCDTLRHESAWGEGRRLHKEDVKEVLDKMEHVFATDGMVGFARTLDEESGIAECLLALMKEPTALGIPEKTFSDMAGTYNEEQMEFLRGFDKNSVMLLLGRGGTGKTHTICGAIRLFRQRFPNDEVKLCAPTARAAGVLKEHSGEESSTIHILLGLRPYSPYDDIEEGDGEDKAGRDNAGDGKKVEAKLVIVDEVSMVDTDLMYRLLRAIRPGTKLILSGDPDQLESVGAGAVLRDMMASGAVPKTVLTKVMRQEEGSAIIANCGKILDGDPRFITNANFHVRGCKSEPEALAYLKSRYHGDPKQTQILTTTKKGQLGTALLNQVFHDGSRDGVFLHGEHFAVGDKVIFTRNNYDMGYCNGDIGFITDATMPVSVKKQGEGKTIKIGHKEAMDMEHATAITVHKSQGGEYQSVYILLPEAPKGLLTRNMVNTAVSRARREVHLITVGDSLRTAASNRYRRNRVTRLKEKLDNLREIREAPAQAPAS